MILDATLLAITILLSLFTIILLLTSGKFDKLLKPLNDKEFPLKEIYGIGFRFMEIFRINMKSKMANRMRKEAAIVYGKKYAEYYLQVSFAQRYSYIISLIVLISCFVCICDNSDRVILVILAALVIFVVNYYYITLFKSKIDKNAKRYLIEFPNIVSTLALLVNAGMILPEAWTVVANSGDSELYEKMREVNEETKNGVPMTVALDGFAKKCATTEIKKFISSLIQGLEKGNRELEIALRQQSQELWYEKKQTAVKLGELAGNKLMIPIVIMFVGILIMVMVPMMSNML